MAGDIRGESFFWHRYAAICILVILIVVAGCSMATSPSPGKNGNDNGGSGGGNKGGSSQSVGDTGTETWQATFSVTENDHTTMSKTLRTEKGTQKEEATSSMEFHGSFPVVMAHEKESYGDHYYLASSPDNGYPASGSYESHDHIDSTGAETGCHPMAFENFDEQRTGSIAKTNFDFAVEGPTQYVQVDNSFPTTIQTKEVHSDAKGCPNSEETTTQDSVTWYQCHSDTPNPDDTFAEGTHDFHREGSRYVILCHATITTPFKSDSDARYDSGSAETRDITLKVTMDPDYVQGTPTPTPSPTPKIPEPTVSLAPLNPTVSLAPLVTSGEPSLAPLVTPTP